MSATLESKAIDLAADIGKLGATALRIKEERDELAKALSSAVATLEQFVKLGPGPGAYERIADCSDSAYPEANAKLIAAAPDLVEVLREIAAGGWSDVIEPVALARAVLAKAGL